MDARPCARCDGTRFALVKQATDIGWRMEWASAAPFDECQLLVCLRCGHIHFFLPQPERLLRVRGVTRIEAARPGASSADFEDK